MEKAEGNPVFAGRRGELFSWTSPLSCDTLPASLAAEARMLDWNAVEYNKSVGKAAWID